MHQICMWRKWLLFMDGGGLGKIVIHCSFSTIHSDTISQKNKRTVMMLPFNLSNFLFITHLPSLPNFLGDCRQKIKGDYVPVGLFLRRTAPPPIPIPPPPPPADIKMEWLLFDDTWAMGIKYSCCLLWSNWAMITWRAGHRTWWGCLLQEGKVRLVKPYQNTALLTHSWLDFFFTLLSYFWKWHINKSLTKYMQCSCDPGSDQHFSFKYIPKWPQIFKQKIQGVITKPARMG